MFCSKCGKELPDDATFCSGCGNQVGGTRPAQAAGGGMPPILEKLISQTASFFMKKDPVGTVAKAAEDKTFSGAILIVFGFLMYALAAMVNVNQIIVSLIKDAADGEKIPHSIVKQFFPSGTVFGFSVLTGFLVALVAVVGIFVVGKFLLKKNVTVAGAIGIVGYASIPLTCVYILNMLLGLIWMWLPFIFSLTALAGTLILMFGGFNKAYGASKGTYGAYMIVVLLLVIVAVLFGYLTAKNGVSAIGGGITGSLGNLFS